MLKPGDLVRIKVQTNENFYYCYGEVTLIGSLGVKVLFGDPLYDYNYYKEEELELINPEDLNENSKCH